MDREILEPEVLPPEGRTPPGRIRKSPRGDGVLKIVGLGLLTIATARVLGRLLTAHRPRSAP